MIEIKTKRLTLRPLGMRYLQTVHVYASDLENTKYMTRLPNQSLDETKEFLSSSDREWESEKPSFYEFAILYQNGHIGAVSLYLNEDRSAEAGWILNKKYWKQGFAYEAASGLLDFAVRELQIRHFIAHCDSENAASYKVMEGLGMSRVNVSGGRKNRASDEERMEYRYELHVDQTALSSQ